MFSLSTTGPFVWRAFRRSLLLTAILLPGLHSGAAVCFSQENKATTLVPIPDSGLTPPAAEPSNTLDPSAADRKKQWKASQPATLKEEARQHGEIRGQLKRIGLAKFRTAEEREQYVRRLAEVIDNHPGHPTTLMIMGKIAMVYHYDRSERRDCEPDYAKSIEWYQRIVDVTEPGSEPWQNAQLEINRVIELSRTRGGEADLPVNREHLEQVVSELEGLPAQRARFYPPLVEACFRNQQPDQAEAYARELLGVQVDLHSESPLRQELIWQSISQLSVAESLMRHWRYETSLTSARKKEKIASLAEQYPHVKGIGKERDRLIAQIDQEIEAGKPDVAAVLALYPKSVLAARPSQPGHWPVWKRLLAANGTIALVIGSGCACYHFMKQRNKRRAGSGRPQQS